MLTCLFLSSLKKSAAEVLSFTILTKLHKIAMVPFSFCSWKESSASFVCLRSTDSLYNRSFQIPGMCDNCAYGSEIKEIDCSRMFVISIALLIKNLCYLILGHWLFQCVDLANSFLFFDNYMFLFHFVSLISACVGFQMKQQL